MPMATMRSAVVTDILRSKTGGTVGSDTNGMVKIVSVNGMLRRKMTMLKKANGSSRRGKAIRYMAIGFLRAGAAGVVPSRASA
jgi:hypothetical protein